jgi:hypothetical protein
VCVRVGERVRGCVHARVALLIQHAKRMRQIVASFVVAQASPYFSTLSHKRHNFKKKKVSKIKCVFFIFSTNVV